MNRKIYIVFVTIILNFILLMPKDEIKQSRYQDDLKKKEIYEYISDTIEKSVDLKKKEIYEYVNNIYEKSMNSNNSAYDKSMDRQKDVFETLNTLMIFISISILLLGVAGVVISRIDKNSLKELLEIKTQSYKDELEKKEREIEGLKNEDLRLRNLVNDFEKELNKFTKEIKVVKESTLLAQESQKNYNKLFSGRFEDVFDGITKLTDSIFYSPLIHKKIRELSNEGDKRIRIAALKALAVFGDSDAFKHLKDLAKMEKDAKDTLKHLEEEYPAFKLSKK